MFSSSRNSWKRLRSYKVKYTVFTSVINYNCFSHVPNPEFNSCKKLIVVFSTVGMYNVKIRVVTYKV